VARYARDRLGHDRGTRLVLGQAVAGRLAQTVFDRGIPLFTETGLRSLILHDGVVVGLRTSGAHGDREILAKRGVVLATGGFPQNATLRAQHMAHVRDGAKHYSVSPMAGTGDAIEAARAVGAALDETNSNAGFWAPVSLLPTKAGPKPFPHLFLDRAKPGVIAINGEGRRFVNEAFSYHDFVEGMIRAGERSAWLVCDHTTLRRYGLGAVRPFPAPIGTHVRSGYLKKADSVDALARVIGVPSEALSGTLASYNADALSGEDRAFGKGSTAYQTYLGDPQNKPNPCLRPVEDGPFYAIEIFPGDIGTSVGLATDADGRVLTENGDVLPGLYACGNDMNSIMGGAYPGAGITLGPALTFGYIVGQSALASSEHKGETRKLASGQR
jgi:succinate dehydrogenase/fumarate reductase flavoprotein subunit